MPLLLLIRHGENDFVKTGKLPGQSAGIHLNEKGQKQAQALGEALAQVPLKAVYSSPLERALGAAAWFRVLSRKGRERPRRGQILVGCSLRHGTSRIGRCARCVSRWIRCTSLESRDWRLEIQAQHQSAQRPKD